MKNGRKEVKKMKKMLFSVLLAVVSISVGACGSSNSEITRNETQKTEKIYVVDGIELTEDEYNAYLNEKSRAEASNEQIQEDIIDIEETNGTTDTVDDNNETTDTMETGENILDIHIGDVFNLSNGKNELEITLNDVNFEQEVYSTSDNMFASYFPDIDGESYLVMKLSIKNLGGDNISYQLFDSYNSEKIVAMFADKYNYRMQQLDTTSSVMSEYWTIAPLKNLDVYFLQTIPDEIIDQPFTITFKLVDDDVTCKYSKE